jgi:hypothetical protein
VALKSIWLLALVVTTLMVAALLDAAPDPPAIDPHAVNVKAAGKATALRDFPDALRPVRLERDSRSNQVSVPARGVRLADTVEPEQPSERTAIVRRGSDSSPPRV